MRRPSGAGSFAGFGIGRPSLSIPRVQLAISITLEAAELLEHFQWKRPGEVEAFLAREENRKRLGEEMADVLILLISLADAAGLDLLDAARAKLEQNAKKYPVDRARGTARKYDELVP